MKSASLPKGFPANPKEWEKLIDDAPGEDRPPTAGEEAAWAKAVVVREGGYPAVKAALAQRRARGQRGPNKRPTKESVTVRYSPDVLAAFRATGRGWQSRMDDALRDWLKTHSSA